MSRQYERRLTPQQHAELLAWNEARKKLGTRKTKCRELGISTGGMDHYLRTKPRSHA